MNYIYMKARAKINVSLDITGKREDGYHDIKTIMQTIDLSDGLFIKKIYKDNYYKLITNLRWLPVGEKNLITKAFEAIKDRFDLKCGVFIELKKNIPVSAGLAGGSADCAAALIGLKRLFDLPLSKQELLEIGKSLGADVPFCIEGGTMLAEGIGEKLTRLPPHPYVHVLLIKPPVTVSTADVFKKYDNSAVICRPNTEKIIRYIEEKNTVKIASEFCNVLETVTLAKYPIISEYKKEMIKSGALGSVMSGSGPTVLGYYNSRREAILALEYIKKLYPDTGEYRISKISNYII